MDDVEHGLEIEDVHPAQAEEIYRRVLADKDAIEKAKEKSIYALGRLLAHQQKAQELGNLLIELRPHFSTLPRARTARIGRLWIPHHAHAVQTLINLVGQVPGTREFEIHLCEESVQWARADKRTFLRQRIETHLIELYLDHHDYDKALTLVGPLLHEVKKLDDKPLIVQLHLLESRIHFPLRNLPKAKACLTAGRTAAAGIYCEPELQAAIDMQAGILHAEEKDFKTASSYFFEAFDGFSGEGHPNALPCLKYMLLCKIMLNDSGEVDTILNQKSAQKYIGIEAEAMKAIAQAHKARSLHTLEAELDRYKAQLEEDAIIHTHLSALRDSLFEQHLSRLLEPFSRVEVSHLAELIDLPVNVVETKLSQMILDKHFRGILDQSNGCVIVFNDPDQDPTYTTALETIDHVGKIVESLYEKAAEI